MYKDSKDNHTYEIKIIDENEDKQKQDHETGLEEQNARESAADVASQDNKPEIPGINDQYFDHFLRLQAEFANYKKRIEREKLELSDFFKSELVGSLLPVIDDFERMLNHPVTSHENNEEFFKGTTLIYQKFIGILERQGLKAIQTVGKRFDPSFHEAILIEAGNSGDNDIVVEEWRKGYLFNDRLLRPAQVKVLKTESVNEK